MNKEKNTDIEFEIRFFEDLLKDDPHFIDALIPLAEAYTQKGLYEQGLELDLRLSRLKPNDAVIHYNLACSYALTNNTDLALSALNRSLMLGYRDFEWLEADTDLNSIRADQRYSQLLEKFSSLPAKKTYN